MLFRAVVFCALFWAGFGVYVYREAQSNGRSSPRRRDWFWIGYGIAGVVTYVTDSQNRVTVAIPWVALAIVLIGFWTLLVIGVGNVAAFRGWAAIFTGLFIIYWQFDLAQPR